MITRHPYQTTGSAWLAGHARAALLDEPGLGKSVQAIDAADDIMASRILVLCPGAVRINWAREFQKFSIYDRAITVALSGKHRIPTLPDQVVIVSYDLAAGALADTLLAQTWDVLIADEAHFLKTPTAKRTRTVYGPGCNGKGLVERCDRVWLLSGTLMPSDPSELYTHLRALWPASIENKFGKVRNHHQFTMRYCRTANTPFGLKILGAQNTDELKSILKPITLRRRKADVLKDLPPIRFGEMYVEVGGATLRELQQHEDYPSLVALINDPTSIEAKAVDMASVRRLIATAKAIPLAQQIAGELDGGLDKIVVFGHHREPLETIAAALGKYGVSVVHGGVAPAKRQAAIDAFQTGSNRVFVGQITAAGTGLTLTAASNLVFAELSWVPADNVQAAQRVHRIGQEGSVLVRYAMLAGSVDEKVTEALRRKVEMVRSVVG